MVITYKWILPVKESCYDPDSEVLSNKEGLRGGHKNLPGKGKKILRVEWGQVGLGIGGIRWGGENTGRNDWNWVTFQGRGGNPVQWELHEI